jgi:hypothetical protein
MIRANRRLRSPIHDATIKVDMEISMPDFIRKKRKPCPRAAKKAETKMALRDGFELMAKPMAVMAAIIPSITIN